MVKVNISMVREANWKESLNKLIYAYEVRSQGFFFYVLFRRGPGLPTKSSFLLTPETGTSGNQEYIKNGDTEVEANGITRENARRSAERSKRYYNNKVRSSVLEESYIVPVRSMTPRGGTGKHQSHW